MTKSELMSLLDKRLSILNEAEREDIKQDYEQHIQMKMGEGLTEAEAIETLGDIETIIDETLMAYNIDPNYSKNTHPDIGKKIRQALNSDFAQKTGETLNKGLDAVHNAVSSNSPEDIIKALFKIFLFCIAAFILFVFGFMVFSAISAVLREILPSALMLDVIVSGAVKLMYVVIFTAAVCAYIYSYITKNADNIKKAVTNKEDDNMTEAYKNTADANTDRITEGTYAGNTQQGTAVKGSGRAEIAAKIFDIFLFVLKICIFFAVLPLFFGVIAMITALGLFLTALFMGYPTLGISLMCLGISICIISFLIFVFKLIFGEAPSQSSQA